MSKLFIVCPFSILETSLREKYGNNTLFLTAIGGVLQYRDYEYIISIKNLIEREKVSCIYFVNDTSCRFINNILNKEKLHGFDAERTLEDIYIDHYFSEFKGQPLLAQQEKLAELNVGYQAMEIINSTILGDFICNNNILVKGLVTSKKRKLFIKVPITQHLEYS